MKTEHGHAAAAVRGLLAWGVETFVYVPSSHAAGMIRGLQAKNVPGILATREEEAVGIAAGLALTGCKAAVVMQDNGFGNALTALTTFAKAYHIALPIVANTRGGLGEYNAMIHEFSESVPALLRDAGIRVEHMTPSQSPALWETTVRAACELAVMTHRPVVVLLDLLHPALSESA